MQLVIRWRWLQETENAFNRLCHAELRIVKHHNVMAILIGHTFEQVMEILHPHLRRHVIEAGSGLAAGECALQIGLQHKDQIAESTSAKHLPVGR